ncbi:MAG: hypothetical protein QNI99_05250 [Woeseiaceae bacterium]|nr:hypothetical protein [Woeseiaceae bacterium]
MTISYDYDADIEVLHCRVGEDLVISEVADYLRSVHLDEQIKDGSFEIVYLDHVADFALRAQNVRDAEPQLRDRFSCGRLAATVFVGSRPLQVGIANMLSGLLVTMFPDYPAPVVRGRDEALEEIERIRSGAPVAAAIEGEKT